MDYFVQYLIKLFVSDSWIVGGTELNYHLGSGCPLLPYTISHSFPTTTSSKFSSWRRELATPPPVMCNHPQSEGHKKIPPLKFFQPEDMTQTERVCHALATHIKEYRPGVCTYVRMLKNSLTSQYTHSWMHSKNFR